MYEYVRCFVKVKHNFHCCYEEPGINIIHKENILSTDVINSPTTVVNSPPSAMETDDVIMKETAISLSTKQPIVTTSIHDSPVAGATESSSSPPPPLAVVSSPEAINVSNNASVPTTTVRVTFVHSLHCATINSMKPTNKKLIRLFCSYVFFFTTE